MNTQDDDETTSLWVDKRARQARARAQIRSGERTRESMFFISRELARTLKIVRRTDEF